MLNSCAILQFIQHLEIHCNRPQPTHAGAGIMQNTCITTSKSRFCSSECKISRWWDQIWEDIVLTCGQIWSTCLSDKTKLFSLTPKTIYMTKTKSYQHLW